MNDRLAERLQQAGYRLTLPRRAVLEALGAEETRDEDLSPAQILERGRRTYPALSRATVYRTLDLLEDLGVLRLIHAGDGRSRVVFVERGHHHLLCLGCGTAVHFEECIVSELEETLSKRLGFQIKSHLLELYGLCEGCRERD